MIACVQRVSRAEVRVPESGYAASIAHGIVVLLGVERGDGSDSAEWLAAKIAALRLFSDEAGKFNRSLRDIAGSALVISQFTLAGDCRKGTRPGFDAAERPEAAEPLYDHFVRALREVEQIPVETGVFAAMMEVELVNDGPVTLILRHPRA